MCLRIHRQHRVSRSLALSDHIIPCFALVAYLWAHTHTYSYTQAASVGQLVSRIILSSSSVLQHSCVHTYTRHLVYLYVRVPVRTLPTLSRYRTYLCCVCVYVRTCTYIHTEAGIRVPVRMYIRTCTRMLAYVCFCLVLQDKQQHRVSKSLCDPLEGELEQEPLRVFSDQSSVQSTRAYVTSGTFGTLGTYVYLCAYTQC